MKHCEMRSEPGFTLIEMLISMAVFTIVVLAAYYFITTGQWYSMHSERKANMFDNGRIAMERMERDFRLIGYGVPAGGETGNTSNRWFGGIFGGTVAAIAFHGDVDNGNARVFEDMTDGDTDIRIETLTPIAANTSSPTNNFFYYDQKCDGITPIVVSVRFTQWFSSVCNSTDGINQLNIDAASPTNGTSYTAAETQVNTIERVDYQMTGDDGSVVGIANNGICDKSEDEEATCVANPLDPCRLTPPDCKIQRSQQTVNDPLVSGLLDPTTFTTFEDIATNIYKLEIQYFDANNAEITGATTPPLPVDNTMVVSRIAINLTIRDRSGEGVGKTQDAGFTSDVVVRHVIP